MIAHDADIKELCELYKYRWQIETMFKAFKSGFNMEAIYITDPLRLQNLFSVMAIAFTIAYDIGDKYERAHPQKIKNHGYKPKTTLGFGLDMMLNYQNNIKSIQELLRIIAQKEGCPTDVRELIIRAITTIPSLLSKSEMEPASHRAVTP